jgi:hypothetical protein
MQIGFGNGNFWRLNRDDFERFDERLIQIFLDAKSRALELHCRSAETLQFLLEKNIPIIKKFDHVSMHMPDLIFDDDIQTHNALNMTVKVCNKYKICNVVFHADKVRRWDVIGSYDIPVSIENMDGNKDFGNTIEDIKSILDHHNFGLTLDLQHCFAVDPTMQTAMEFQGLYKDRIVEYHISGHDEEKLHWPLFKTKQDIIIRSLLYPEIPIIIESEFENYDEAGKELNYIKSRME